MSPPYILSVAAVSLFFLHLHLHLVASHQTPSPPPSTPTPMPTPTPTPAAGNQMSQNLIAQRQIFVREFLTAHNKYRSSFQLPPLVWNKNLTRYARRWGEKRAADCKMIHSKGPYGENLFWGKLEHWTPSEVVASWGRENQFYDLNSNACADGQICGHYTQIIWKESLRLGCARVNCLNGEMLVICEYDPPGNYYNEKPV